MSKGKDEEKTTLNCYVGFPEIAKSDRDLKYNKFVLLMEENKSAFSVKVVINREKKRVMLDAKDFAFNISFGKQVSMSIIIHDPNINKATANEVGSKIVNYLNTILGETAIGAKVNCILITSVSKKGINMAERILGEGRIARASELTGQTLKPISIGFEYKIGERSFMFSTFSNDTCAQLVGSNIVYKDRIPFNFLEKEITELDCPISLIKRLTEAEM